MRLFIALALFAALTVPVSGHASAASNKAPAKPLVGSSQGAPGEIYGTVREIINSGGYTYLRLESPGGVNIWTAVPEMKIKKGQKVTLQPGMEMTDFESKTLNRKFDRIVFSAGLSTGKKKGAASSEVKGPGSKGSVTTPAEKIKVEKAAGENAYAVGEIYKNASGLADKEVIVRGKVVKVSQGILGRNWIHIQDGSGDPSRGSHNLVVTTKDLPKMGDIVTASGVLRKEKDFGAGYQYYVILEDASVKP